MSYPQVQIWQIHFSSALEVFFPSPAEEGFFPAASDLEAVLVFIFSCFYGTYDLITSKKINPRAYSNVQLQE